MNAKQKITLIAVDVAILVELCVGMYAASHDPENFTPAFCKAFFSLFVPTLLGGITLIRLLRDKVRSEPDAA
ncbi:hypothetical protein [Fundidesulfovibrio soli]|uniref:hypothetical protein n=1 Tax=Fundidesulfovibrio soli TaxID=2922716 RepID=UPI001FAFE4E7|nr:hypothetical protein [Fundidesulfovibrio soli]